MNRYDKGNNKIDICIKHRKLIYRRKHIGLGASSVNHKEP